MIIHIKVSSAARGTTKLNRTKVLTVLYSNFGEPFEVTFIKKDGTIRFLKGRLGVIPATPGGQNKVMKPENSYLTVFDDEVHEYRTVNLSTMLGLKIDNKTYSIVGD